MAPWQPTAATMKEPKVAVMYIGDPANKGDGPDVLKSWGFTFPKGEAVEVPESLAKRLAKSMHFQAGDMGAAEAEEPADPTQGMAIDELRAMADQMGIMHDGVKKADLREMIREKMKG